MEAIEDPKKSYFHGVVKGDSAGTGGERMRKGEMEAEDAFCEAVSAVGAGIKRLFHFNMEDTKKHVRRLIQ